jgi:hypothetical protein
VVEVAGETLLFDCLFDDEIDDYPDNYRVVRLDREVAKALHQISCVDLGSNRVEIGRVPTRAVVFDPTRRAAVDAAILEQL